MKSEELELSNFIDVFLYYHDKYPYIQTYLKDCVSAGYVIQHGVSNNTVNGKYYVKNNVEGRKPTNSSLYAHEYFDSFLEEKFNIPFRSNSLFTTAKGNSAYGKNFLVIPLFEPTYCSSPIVYDLYMIWQQKLVSAADNVYAGIDSMDISDESKIQLKNDNESILDIVYSALESGSLFSKDSIDQLPDYIKKKIDGDINEEAINAWATSFLKFLHFSINKVLNTYQTTNSLSNIHSNVISKNYEIMVNSPKFLFINTKELTSKHAVSPLEFFEKMITRYESGERF